MAGEVRSCFVRENSFKFHLPVNVIKHEKRKKTVLAPILSKWKETLTSLDNCQKGHWSDEGAE